MLYHYDINVLIDSAISSVPTWIGHLATFCQWVTAGPGGCQPTVDCGCHGVCRLGTQSSYTGSKTTFITLQNYWIKPILVYI